MVHADKASGELHRVQFGHWVGRHCPRLLIGLREWTKSLLLPQSSETSGQRTEEPSSSEAGSSSPPSTTSSPVVKLSYQLPLTEIEESAGEEKVLEREVEVCTLTWSLSTVLPLIYFGQKETGKLQPDAKVRYHRSL